MSEEEKTKDEEGGLELDQQAEEFLTAWFQVRQQVQALNFNRAHQQGFSVTQFMLMNLMGDDGQTTIGGLAGRLNLDPATIVRTVDTLENRGLVQRRRDKQDRRVVFVEFTEEGRIAQHTLHQRFTNSVREIFASMSIEGRVALVRGLKEFVESGEHELKKQEPERQN